ncbi:MAG: glycosyltransferase family A protein [Plesiomonas sp.]|uniref:glycosyltransferase family A protein n=1 Tax=Plesiomonas sp. TaxID=2486279 RepID=UPI003F336889
MKPITILIPSYNHAIYITELFESIDKIGEENFHVLIIDDCSSDGSDELIKKYAENKSNVSFYIKDKNKGLVDSLKLGIAKIKTDYFYLIASDDVIDYRGFLTALNHMQINPCLFFCIFGANSFSDDRCYQSTYTRKHRDFFSLSGNEIAEKIFYAHPAPILLQSTIFKTSEFKHYNLIDDGLKFDDYPIFIKYFQILKDETIKHFEFFPEINLVNYRHHDNNTYNNHIKMYSMFEAVYNKLAPNAKICNHSKAMYWYLYFIKSIFSLKLDVSFSLLKKYKLSYVKYFPLFIYYKVK